MIDAWIAFTAKRPGWLPRTSLDPVKSVQPDPHGGPSFQIDDCDQARFHDESHLVAGGPLLDGADVHALPWPEDARRASQASEVSPGRRASEASDASSNR